MTSQPGKYNTTCNNKGELGLVPNPFDDINKICSKQKQKNNNHNIHMLK